MKTGTWRPLLGGAIAREALEAVEAIATAGLKPRRRPSEQRGIAVGKRRSKNPSLSEGSAGLAVFYGYLSRSRSGSRHEEVRERTVFHRGGG